MQTSWVLGGNKNGSVQGASLFKGTSVLFCAMKEGTYFSSQEDPGCTAAPGGMGEE